MRLRGILLAFGFLAQAVVSADGERPFTVADSIELTRLADPDIAFETAKALTFKNSPDGSAFVIVTRTGSLASGLNEFSLVLFNVADVTEFVNSPGRTRLPQGDVLLKFRNSAEAKAIDEVRWLPGGKRLAFIGRGPDELGQVYVFEIGSRRLRKLTNHPSNIVTFDLVWERQKLVYAAQLLVDWGRRNAYGYAVKSEDLKLLLSKEPEQADLYTTSIKYFVMDLGEDRAIPLSADTGLVAYGVSISPSGERAVIPIHVPTIPPEWRQYEVVRAHELKYAAVVTRTGAQIERAVADSSTALVENDAIPSEFAAHGTHQFHLVDLKTGLTQPLLDAPTFARAYWLGKAQWSADGSRVILPTTFLPLDTKSRNERGRRRRSQAIVEVRLSDGTISRIADISDRTTNGARLGDPVLVEEYSPGHVVVQQDLLDPFAKAASKHFLYYRKQRGRWVPDNEPAGYLPLRANGLELRVVQDMNTPPDIVARDPTTGRERRITDFNPQLRDLALGRVETFEWADRIGRRFRGGLVLPPGYKVGTRYPVVIQTYGFREDEFLVDGPLGITTAYSARAIANKDILVLQMPAATMVLTDGGAPKLGRRASGEAYEDYAENPRFIAQLEGAIDALDGNGLIDRNRVGLIGFSREGMHVHNALTFSNYPIAAATVADSTSSTPFCYAVRYGAPYPSGGMYEFEDEYLKSIGAPPWKEGIDLWLQRSDFYHLYRIRTPIRYEHLGTAYFPCHWDAFGLLKRLNRPVEMVHLPLASHVIQQPYARYTSQQGNVDWFAYWLKDEEDPDPEKSMQYERWRKLRAQHTHHLRALQANKQVQ